MAVVFGPRLMQSPATQRGLLALALASLATVLLLTRPTAGVLVLLVYLSVMGGLRRILIPVIGWSATDPLLLVVPVAVTLHFATLFLKQSVPFSSRMDRLVFMLLLLMVAQMLNPLQGGLSVGVAGGLFYVVPVLWYYVGRLHGNINLQRQVFSCMIIVAFLASLHGLHQVWFGFSEVEQAWLDLSASGYAALQVNGRMRPFAFFTSAAEYAFVLGFGLVALWAHFLSGSRLALLAMPVLAVALFLESSRGVVLLCVTACALVWALKGRSTSWAPRIVLAVATGFVGLTLVVGQVQKMEFDERAQGLIEHQTEGLANPLDSEKSTLGLHQSMMGHSLVTALKNPVGYGLGSTTLAAAKFGGNVHSAEFDIINILVSLGYLGAVTFVPIIIIVLGQAIRYWRETGASTALVLAGLLFFSIGHWLNGGQYAACALIWFCIGCVAYPREMELSEAGPSHP